MLKLEEKDFIVGNNNDICGALLLREDCNGYIDSVLEQIYELDLTQEEEKNLGIQIHREKYNNTWKMVKFIFGPGNEVVFSKNDSIYQGKVYKTTHELRCNGQLDSDKKISILSNFAIVGSHTLLSYNESSEDLNFDCGNEIFVKFGNEENLTQYSKLGITKKPIFDTKFGQYSYEYLKRDTYKEKYNEGLTAYFDLDGKPLTQSEIIATSFDSFSDSYTSFKNEYMMCRELVDSRLKEIITNKTK